MGFRVALPLLPLLLFASSLGDDYSGNNCDNILYEQFGDYCLRTFSYPAKVSEARGICAEDNAFLPSAHDPTELYDLYSYVSQTGYSTPDSSVLLGLTCFGSTKSSFWDDMTSYDYGLFSRDQIPEGISCVEMLNSDIGWTYKFGDCNTMETTFACVLPQTDESILACPDDFDPVEDRCIRYVPATASHAEAEQVCQKTFPGTHLASVHSKNKVAELQKELDGAWSAIHIGLSEDGGEYKWSDGSTYDFRNWEPNYPNSERGKCVRMETKPTSNGMWRNIPCFVKLPYFCELPASVKPSKSPMDFPPTSGDNDCPSDSGFHDHGYVTSPGYPAITTGNICDYHLSSPSGTVVSLKFLDFSMCNPQHAVIYDGPSTSNTTKVLATLTYYSTASEINKVYVSSGNTMTVHYDFHADQCDNAGRGFVFRFETQKH
ncbi:hypothetical protein QR680_016962 [Steinernema hermaphroditum]|uniref:C-type lectin domain-containing protein n=1 Tax=Steinernema hermaphroditum TaxID=289476 RepID=A0AA39HCU9_9BILA|nr:hypothetical protein QR680_016962 [Steinernema hermaphroditum]